MCIGENNMDDHLGDKILTEFINGSTRDEIIKKFGITEKLYNAWEKINSNELQKIKNQLEKRQWKQKLKIRNIPEYYLSSDTETDESEQEQNDAYSNKFLRREPPPVPTLINNQSVLTTVTSVTPPHPLIVTEDDKRVELMSRRKNQILEKILQLESLRNNGKIDEDDFTRAANILNNELKTVNNALNSKS